MLPALASSIHRIDPSIAAFGAFTMSQRLDNSPAAYLRRASAWLVGGFATLALFLSAVGLYGVVAYSVSCRTREIGVRMALGAQRSTVYRLILGESGWLAAIGIVLGLVVSVAASTLLGSLLFGVRPWDAPTLVAVAVLFGLAALLASYLPARRAASIDPIEALRAE
jgi:ABC-type antimicrobial peptide transport system permease subunit